MFEGGRCAFGQSKAAQGHLRKNGIGSCDVFLFFGLFTDLNCGDRHNHTYDNDWHHRIFGYLEVEEVMNLGPKPPPESQPRNFTRTHPHTLHDQKTQ